MLSLKDYNLCVKPFRQEEFFDYLLYRPIAFLILFLTNRLPLTPDHFSLIGLLISVMAFFFLKDGDPQGFFYGGCCIFLFSVIDCCDGMLSRLKKNGSQYGELVDMLVDLVANIFFYIGLFIGLTSYETTSPIRYLSLVSALFIFLHASIYYYYKHRYLCYVNKNPNLKEEQNAKYRIELDKLNTEKGHFFQKFLLKAYLVFNETQPDSKKNAQYDSEKYTKYNINTLPLWGIIAGSSHLTILAISLMLNSIESYFIYSIVLANIWLLLSFFIQLIVNKKTEFSHQ